MVSTSESEQVSTEKITSKYIHPAKEAKEGDDSKVPNEVGSEQAREPPSILETLAIFRPIKLSGTKIQSFNKK